MFLHPFKLFVVSLQLHLKIQHSPTSQVNAGVLTLNGGGTE